MEDICRDSRSLIRGKKKTQEAKKNLLFNSNQEYLWITEKDIGNKFYRQCIKEVKAQKLCKTLDQHAILDLPTPCKH